MAEAQAYMAEREGHIEEHSAEDYFTMLLERGLDAREQGNYGIAAAMVVRSGGTELIIFGQNDTVSAQNPLGHAEMNTVVTAMKINNGGIDALKALSAEGQVIVRNAPHTDDETFLVTTLEPCPMCTVGAAINAKAKKVLVGTPDAPGGQLEKSRLEALSPVWQDLAEKQQLEAVFAQSDDPAELATYLPSELQGLLLRLFFETKEPIDQHLGEKGFLPLLDLVAIAQLALAEQEETE